jgi:glycerol-3-phosphate dehydrogenase
VAKTLVNAAGPWVGEVLGGVVRSNTKAAVRMVQGSHIVVPKLYEHDRCYIFQNADGRIIFAIPYEHDFTLIGTTDRDYRGDPAQAKATPAEIDYLCAAASEYFRAPVTPGQVVWTYSGVRPLYDDGASKAQEATRDYVLTLDAPEGEAPLLSVFGGKITTYRRLAEAALAKLAPHAAWAARPVDRRRHAARRRFPGDRLRGAGQRDRRSPSLAGAIDSDAAGARLWHPQARDILDGAQGRADLGRHFGADLYERECAT